MLWSTTVGTAGGCGNGRGDTKGFEVHSKLRFVLCTDNGVTLLYDGDRKD